MHAARAVEPAHYVRRRKDASLTLYGPGLSALITAAVSRELEHHPRHPGLPGEVADLSRELGRLDFPVLPGSRGGHELHRSGCREMEPREFLWR